MYQNIETSQASAEARQRRPWRHGGQAHHALPIRLPRSCSPDLPAGPSPPPAAALSPAGGDGGEHSEGASPSCTFLLNSQSIDALAFRVDVTSKRDGTLLARCYVEPATLQVGWLPAWVAGRGGPPWCFPPALLLSLTCAPLQLPNAPVG